MRTKWNDYLRWAAGACLVVIFLAFGWKIALLYCIVALGFGFLCFGISDQWLAERVWLGMVVAFTIIGAFWIQSVNRADCPPGESCYERSY